MPVQWSRELLNRHVAPGIDDFGRADIPVLSVGVKASSGSWMFDHFVNSVFRGQYRDPVREQAINCIYRVQTAIRAYQEAGALTASYLSESQPGSPVIRLYFETLSTWEMCILNWQMFVEVYNRLSCPETVFKPKDGSIDEQAYQIACSIKHSGGAGSGGTVPMWLTNNGFQTSNHRLTYEQLAQLLIQAGEFVQQIIDPKN